MFFLILLINFFLVLGWLIALLPLMTVALGPFVFTFGIIIYNFKDYFVIPQFKKIEIKLIEFNKEPRGLVVA